MTGPATPILVEESSTKAVTGTSAAILLIILTSFPTLLGFWQTRDLIGFMIWLKTSPEGIALWTGATAGLAGVTGWRLLSTIRRHVEKLTAARAAPSAVALVKTPEVKAALAAGISPVAVAHRVDLGLDPQL